MPERLSRAHGPDQLRQVAAVCEAHRRAFPGTARARFAVRFYRQGYLSSMYRVLAGGRAYLATVKHHDASEARARREMEVLEARRGRNAPRPLFLDLSRRHLDDPVLVTELVPQGLAARRLRPTFGVLARLLAGIHEDEALAALPSDRDAAPYSLAAELEAEGRAIESFRPSRLRRVLLEIRDMLRGQVRGWNDLFPPAEARYIHGDLPHTHLYRGSRGLLVIHWEFSKRSHPARELGRTATLLELRDEDLRDLLAAYNRHSGARLDLARVRIQELCELFYSSVHTAFWMDRTRTVVPRERVRRAEQQAELVAMALELQLTGRVRRLERQGARRS